MQISEDVSVFLSAGEPTVSSVVFVKYVCLLPVCGLPCLKATHDREISDVLGGALAQQPNELDVDPHKCQMTSPVNSILNIILN